MVGSVITLDSRHYLKAREMASMGHSRESIAKGLGISKSALYTKLKTDQALKDALERGDGEDFQNCLGVMRSRAMEGNYHFMDRYLYFRHGKKYTPALNSAGGGGDTVINVHLPFATGRDGWQDVTTGGEMIEHGALGGESLQIANTQDASLVSHGEGDTD